MRCAEEAPHVGASVRVSAAARSFSSAREVATSSCLTARAKAATATRRRWALAAWDETRLQ